MRMPDEDARALGVRARDCAGWEWIEGMLIREGDYGGPMRVYYVRRHPSGTLRAITGCRRRIVVHAPDRADIWPDLRDPATIGCVLDLVRERAPEWSGPITPEALVAALEGAP